MGHTAQFQLLTDAWDLLRMIDGGDWTTQTPAWRDDAIRFRTAYHEAMRISLPTSKHDTDFGSATSDTMNYTDAIRHAVTGERIIRTGPGGIIIRAIPCGEDSILSARTTNGQWVLWKPCQDDIDAENWVTVKE